MPKYKDPSDIASEPENPVEEKPVEIAPEPPVTPPVDQPVVIIDGVDTRK